MISFVLFLEASQPSMNFNISELVYSWTWVSKHVTCSNQNCRLSSDILKVVYFPVYKIACYASKFSFLLKYIRLIQQQDGNASCRRESVRKGLNTTSGAQFAPLPFKPVVWFARAVVNWRSRSIAKSAYCKMRTEYWTRTVSFLLFDQIANIWRIVAILACYSLRLICLVKNIHGQYPLAYILVCLCTYWYLISHCFNTSSSMSFETHQRNVRVSQVCFLIEDRSRVKNPKKRRQTKIFRQVN